MQHKTCAEIGVDSSHMFDVNDFISDGKYDDKCKELLLQSIKTIRSLQTELYRCKTLLKTPLVASLVELNERLAELESKTWELSSLDDRL